MYILTGIVYLANLFDAFFQKNNKIINWSIILLLCILMGTNTRNPDYYNYHLMFELEKSTIEIGFTSLILISRLFHLSYNAFRLILTIAGFALIHQTVKKVTDHSSSYYLLYMIFPFFMDAVQIRNFLAMSIFIYAIPFLMKGDWKSRFLYILFIAIATSVHILSIVYLLFLLIEPFKKHIKLAKIYFGVVAIMCLLSLYRPLFIVIVDSMVGFLSTIYQQISFYGEISTRFGFLVYWAIQIGFIICTKIILDKLRDENIDKPGNEKRIWMIHFVEIVLWADLISVVFFPTYLIHSLYFRFFRNLIPLNYLVLVGSLPYSNLAKKWKIALIIAIGSLGFVLLYVDVILYYQHEIIDAIFNYSWLIPNGW